MAAPKATDAEPAGAERPRPPRPRTPRPRTTKAADAKAAAKKADEKAAKKKAADEGRDGRRGEGRREGRGARPQRRRPPTRRPPTRQPTSPGPPAPTNPSPPSTDARRRAAVERGADQAVAAGRPAPAAGQPRHVLPLALSPALCVPAVSEWAAWEPPQEIPVVDVAALVARTTGRHTVADAIGAACRESGFFYVVGHGVDADLQDRLERLQPRVLRPRPPRRKLEIRMARGGPAWRGYFPVGGELTSGPPGREGGALLRDRAAAGRPPGARRRPAARAEPDARRARRTLGRDGARVHGRADHPRARADARDRPEPRPRRVVLREALHRRPA